MKRFSDFAEENTVMDGECVKLSSVIDKEICVLQFKIKKSKYQDKCENYATIQFSEKEGSEHKIIFTSSTVIMELLEKYKDELPFITTIKKIDKYYTLS